MRQMIARACMALRLQALPATRAASDAANLRSMESHVTFKIRHGPLKKRLKALVAEFPAISESTSWEFRWVNRVGDIADQHTDCIVLDALSPNWQPEPSSVNFRRPPVILLSDKKRQPHRKAWGYVDECLSPKVLSAQLLEQCLRHSIRKTDLEHQVAYLQDHDALTGLVNQNLFGKSLEHALDRARGSQKLLALFAIRIDRFTDLLGQLGHLGREPLLRAAASRLTATLRRRDLLARAQGDEFLVLLEDIGSVAEATRSADKILQGMQREFEISSQKFALTISIGISSYPDSGTDRASVLAAAKAALDLALSEGNTCRIFDREVASISKRRFEIEQALPEALTRREFEVRYQPQFEIETGQISGAEALLRWYRPTLGEIPPEYFVHLAEESNAILDIGEWVLREALGEAEKWLGNGLPVIRLAVNVSGNQFRNHKILEDVRTLLANSKIQPEQLELELTERVYVHNLQSQKDVFDGLRELGVRIALDDFGVGYSSLSYLKHFAIDALKIDKSFITNLPDSTGDAAIVKAIITIGHSLGMNIIAEGVETEAQLEFLHEQGCDRVQGYFYAAELPGHQFAALIAAEEAGG